MTPTTTITGREARGPFHHGSRAVPAALPASRPYAHTGRGSGRTDIAGGSEVAQSVSPARNNHVRAYTTTGEYAR